MESNPPNILIADDDDSITMLLDALLTGEGFKTSIAGNGSTTIKIFREQSPDLILLDVMLPDIDGIQVCRSIRSMSPVPIIIMTAQTEDKLELECLDIGADDYIKKPFNSSKLLSRIRAILRRSKVQQSGNVDKIEINFGRRVVYVGGKEKVLSRREFDVLYEFFTNQGKVIYYSDLLVKFWGRDYRDATSYVHDCIWSLRQKIETDPNNPQFIINVPGVGYRFSS